MFQVKSQNSKVKNESQNYKSNLKIRCYQFSLKVIALTDNLPNKRSVWVITDQLVRAATSIGANIIEAKASSSRLEFKKFYEISLKSANETKYWLYLLKDAKLINEDKIDDLLIELTEISNMLGAAVIKLKNKHF
jgi:four helix bundle protein